MRKKRFCLAGVVCLFGISLLSVCKANMKDTKNAKQTETIAITEEKADNALIPIEKETVSVHIPGVKKTYKFIFISDLHIIQQNDEILPENAETVQERYEMFKTENGLSAAWLWEKMPEILKTYDADAVFLGGDMIDFASAGNIECLKSGIEKIDVPVMYVRGDHDYSPYYCDKKSRKQMNKLHQSIDGYEKIVLMEFEDLCVMGINDSTEQISDSQLKRIKEIFEIGKPIIILTHVPLDSLTDASLSEKSKEVWQDRALVWGNNCFYMPDKNTEEFLDLVYAENSLVKEVVGGHLHFSWDGMLTDNTGQHVFDKMYTGKIGIITVDGKEE